MNPCLKLPLPLNLRPYHHPTVEKLVTKVTTSNHNINGSKKPQGLHSWWGIGVFSLGDNIKCQTYCQIATEFH
jgi:hypothetical protein